jgi:hypothetical protein
VTSHQLRHRISRGTVVTGARQGAVDLHAAYPGMVGFLAKHMAWVGQAPCMCCCPGPLPSALQLDGNASPIASKCIDQLHFAV